MPVTSDRRQAIIDRLDAILAGMTITLTGTQGTPAEIPPGNFVHNRNELPAKLVPGVILLDADEMSDSRAVPPAPGRQLNQMRDQVVKMTPEIYVVLDVRKPLNLNVGKDLNLARMALLAAIWGDPTIQAIVGPNGAITYEEGVTDLARNRTMQGQMGISITFTYPLKPSEIVGR